MSLGVKFGLLVLVLLVAAGRAAASDAAADVDVSVPSDAEGCPLEAPLPYVTPEQKRHYAAGKASAQERRRECVRELRLRRAQPALEARQRPRIGVTLGYDGALWFGKGHYRAPSVQLAGTFRRQYRRLLGLHVLLGASVGAGRIGAGSFSHDFRRVSVGPSYGAVAEIGLTLGPALGRGGYFLLTSQVRLVVPGASRHTFESSDPAETLTVRWRRPTTGLGLRAGPGLMLGPRHQGFVEAGMGGGALIGRGSAGFVSFGVRGGLLFGT